MIARTQCHIRTQISAIIANHWRAANRLALAKVEKHHELEAVNDQL